MSLVNFNFSVQIWSVIESISVMKMLAEQAEKNVSLALKEADEPGFVSKSEHEEEVYDQYGESHSCQRTYYECGSSIGYDHDEVISEYRFLITQLTRRSAYLTMYGLFEHRISRCLEFMIKITNFEGDIQGKGPIEKAHSILIKAVGGKSIANVDHLTVLRNVMIHNDGIAKNYKKILKQESKKSPAEKRLLRAIHRAEGISVNDFDGVLMDDTFLMYAVNEFSRYIHGVETVMQNYH